MLWTLQTPFHTLGAFELSLFPKVAQPGET